MFPIILFHQRRIDPEFAGNDLDQVVKIRELLKQDQADRMRWSAELAIPK